MKPVLLILVIVIILLLVFVTRKAWMKFFIRPAAPGPGIPIPGITLEHIRTADMPTIIQWFQSHHVQAHGVTLSISGFILRYNAAVNGQEWQVLRQQIPGFEPTATTLLLGFFNKTNNEILNQLPQALYKAEIFSEELIANFGENDLIIAE